jgi:hypothetical protein
MIAALLSFVLSQCPATVIVNETVLPWNETDQAGLVTATKRCSFYYKNSPCLKKFIKKEVNAYHAICGK